MKELYNKNNINIILLSDNYYMIISPYAELKGYYKRINSHAYVVRLDYWKDGKTKRIKSEKNKLFNHTRDWFAYILQDKLKI